ncbi:MAG: hypothetical protein ACFB22_06205 [Rhodothalassiaceae bacterium]
MAIAGSSFPVATVVAGETPAIQRSFVREDRGLAPDPSSPPSPTAPASDPASTPAPTPVTIEAPPPAPIEAPTQAPTQAPPPPVTAERPDEDTSEGSASADVPPGQVGFGARFPSEANIRALENQIARLERLIGESSAQTGAEAPTLVNEEAAAEDDGADGDTAAASSEEPAAGPVVSEGQTLAALVGLDLLRARLAELLSAATPSAGANGSEDADPGLVIDSNA